MGEGIKEPPFIHKSTIVDSDQIGNGTRIWAFAHVMKGARIGEDCNIGEGCFVEGDTVLGNDVTLKNHVCVWDGVTLEDHVFLGPHVVLTNDMVPRNLHRTPVEKFLPTLIKRGASVGANATIICGITIGEHALIGAGSVVTKDVPAHALVYGNPAKVRGYACECGESIDFNQPCHACGRIYQKDSEDRVIQISV